ncbi:thiol:disulfide interchange protein DsbC [Pseudoduganella lurida]|uniref:Thiol:disulfide interchange protein n=1 Tax=Pseudoduganella lurida TaxID=1036180 RepID=A0A562RLH7_9BURK|nr:DsbC family protein [Pseudoduganella lurida]TWI69290.1 thiol:disulfide interchange protein DsbC [Pseudoduganella lurida]
MSSPIIKACGLQLVTALACTPAYSAQPAHDDVALRARLTARYPGTLFGDIRATPLPGIWLVQLGAQSAYVAADGRHFLFGHLVDMDTQTDLSAAPPPVSPVPPTADGPDFAVLPLADAIRTVRGNGSRQVAVFADPDCPYCRHLEQALDRVPDVTVYTFLLPLASLHPTAPARAQSIWCAPDRSAAWRDAVHGQALAPATCANPLARIAAFAAAHGIDGTPYLVFANGQRAIGALDSAAIERHLQPVSE